MEVMYGLGRKACLRDICWALSFMELAGFFAPDIWRCYLKSCDNHLILMFLSLFWFS